MSFQVVQKVRRNASPLNTRQSGPVKATLSFSYHAVTLSGASSSSADAQRVYNAKESKKLSPERLHSTSPGLRDRCSPTSLSTSVASSLGIVSETTNASICSNSYLRGEWPKSDPLVTQAYFCPSNLTVDKASQTPDEWCHSQGINRKSGTRRSSSVGSAGESLRDIKARLAKSSKEAISGANGSGRVQKRASPICVVHHEFNVPVKPIAVPSRNLSRQTSQSSLEDLNQEIERFVLDDIASSRLSKSPSDGRRAPVTREFKLRSSVLTQTPPTSNSSESGDSPLVATSVDNADSFIDFSSREEITIASSSPQLTSFVKERLPPDGCEKVFVKFSEKMLRQSVFNTISPMSTVRLVASEQSAFDVPLERKPVGRASATQGTWSVP